MATSGMQEALRGLFDPEDQFKKEESLGKKLLFVAWKYSLYLPMSKIFAPDRSRQLISSISCRLL